MRQLIASEQSHTRGAKWVQALVIRFECWFTTDGIAHQHDHKVNHFKRTEPFAGEANTLGDFRKQAQTSKGVGEKSHFAKPRRHRGARRSFGLNSHRGRIVRTHTLSYHGVSRSLSCGRPG